MNTKIIEFLEQARQIEEQIYILEDMKEEIFKRIDAELEKEGDCE